MRIYIIGMPGTGKTHFGRVLSRSLNLRFYDLDECLEKQEGMLVRQIITEKGEAYFRNLEREGLEQLARNSHCVIACGGGTPVFHNNMDLMKSSGIVVWLNTNLQIIARRIGHNITRRPMFAGMNEAEIEAKLLKIFAERKKIYAKADIVSEVSLPHNNSLNSVIQRIMKISQRRMR